MVELVPSGSEQNCSEKSVQAVQFYGTVRFQAEPFKKLVPSDTYELNGTELLESNDLVPKNRTSFQFRFRSRFLTVLESLSRGTPHPYPSSQSNNQINVNGLCSPVHQQHLLNFFLHSSFGALSLNDTHFTSSSAKFIFKNEHSQYNFRSYWPTINSWNGCLLKLDLFFHQTKISIISLYNPPSGSVHQNICNDLIAKLLSWLDHARSNNYHVVILSDFNIDEVTHSNYSHNHFRLLHLLSSRYFNDHQARSSSLSGPDPTFYHANGSSRLDYIWSSPGFPAPAAIFNSAVRSLPHQHVSNTHCHSYFPELTKLIAINKFLDKFLYRLTTHHPNQPTQISQMTAALPSHLVDLTSLLPDYSVPVYSTSPLSEFKSFLRSQKNLVSAFLSTKFAQQLTDSVKYCTFIDSALTIDSAVAHFQSVVSPPLVQYSSTALFPPRWQKALSGNYIVRKVAQVYTS
ncbi:hypothetical protein RhiirA4_479783 [Rhizophagus irregularis]|uniref:Endonuclease/exonuclease/phosphatase domain-containing protein n=1 Tax=Rhizophagus irregularis TaxID=588596 RepID=A0A2I1HGY1_9GLOM|nr:hypothetical protein RhiirA4_479783 [Rhizophagus irregularis]